MVYLLSFLFCILFIELFIRWNFLEAIQSVLEFSRKGIFALTSSEMSDDQKEVFIRRQSLDLFKATFSLVAKFLGAFLILYAIYRFICYFLPTIGEALMLASQSVTVLVGLTAFSMLYVWMRRSFSKSYNFIDRLLHHLAFSSPFVQKNLIEIENDLFKRQIKSVTSQREVFITGLPRSGTTLMLELLYDTDEFSTFTYRHMPFVLSPLLWNRLSASFRKKGAAMERAHGDGMVVSFDSPEAFEEVIWLFYLKDKIVNLDWLSPLSVGDQTTEFERAFYQTIKKVLVAGGGAQNLRYLSKNNANISRIKLIHELFPTSSILITFRQPLAHVSSLFKQHQQFTKLHQKDGFAKRYMQWLGHYDFGENFKPINFDNWLKDEKLDSNDVNFWLKYWIAAYSHVLNQNKGNAVFFIDFDKLLIDGTTNLVAVADQLGLKSKKRLVELASRLRLPTSKPLSSHELQPQIVEIALQVHKQLTSLAI
jgi:hypothetical protein